MLGEKTVGGNYDDWGNAIAQTSTNTFLLGGTSSSDVGGDKTEFDRGSADYWIVTLNYQNSAKTTNVISNTNVITNNIQSRGNLVSEKSFAVYPNPFSNSTTVSFSLQQQQKVSIQVFDLEGRLIKTLVNEQMPAGVHQITWNATNESGSMIANGIYYLKLNAGNYSETKKLSVIK